MKLEKGSYSSPRWSKEIYDCSMPMTLDTYSKCAYNCAYCFSVYQKDVGVAKAGYRACGVRSVNIEYIKDMFTLKKETQFTPYIKERRPIQWGGLADQFDEFEREHGVTLELLKFFRSIDYPICFSTKGAWWTKDKRYTDIIKGSKNINVKFSIITTDEKAAKVVEAGCPTPQERIDAMKRIADLGIDGVTLRLRPFIIGLSDRTMDDLINKAGQAGATAISTEFFCLEDRSIKGKTLLFPRISNIIGFDIYKFYKKHSKTVGYLRLSRAVKKPYIKRMQELAKANNMRFYVSDAHFKELCHNGSCCGLKESWHYTRGQFCEALMIAKRSGYVKWSDIEKDLSYAKTFLWRKSDGYNTGSAETRGKFYYHTMYDYLRYVWNNPKRGESPYKMYEGILYPIKKDENGDLVYEYKGV